MKKTNTCCFAGQNPNKLPIHNCSEISADTELKTILFLEIKHLIEKENVTHFISDMELGTDQICAEFVLTLKQFYPHITLECAIPYRNRLPIGLTKNEKNTSRLLKNAIQKNCFRQNTAMTAWKNAVNIWWSKASLYLRYGMVLLISIVVK